MKREPAENDVRAAWSRFMRSGYEWTGPTVKFPLDPPMSVFDTVVNNDPMQPVAMRYAVATIEHGHFDGQRAERLVASVPGTDIEVVLDMRFLP